MADVMTDRLGRDPKSSKYILSLCAPPYGVAVLAGGSQERGTFTEELEQGVAKVVPKLQAATIVLVIQTTVWQESAACCNYQEGLVQ